MEAMMEGAIAHVALFLLGVITGLIIGIMGGDSYDK